MRSDAMLTLVANSALPDCLRKTEAQASRLSRAIDPSSKHGGATGGFATNVNVGSGPTTDALSSTTPDCQQTYRPVDGVGRRVSLCNGPAVTTNRIRLRPRLRRVGLGLEPSLVFAT